MPGTISVEAEAAEGAKNALVRARLLDTRRRPSRRGDAVLFPVTDVARALAAVPGASDAGAVEAPAHRPLRDREPRAVALERLVAEGWPADALAAVPRKWEKLGDVVLVKVPDALRARERELARALADALRARVVLAEEGGVAGELREMAATRPLLGEGTETVHVERGVRYKLDAARIMFSSGNVEERARAARLPAAGETVVDLFAGIGYFTLPLAVHARPARVVAVEKSPLAHRYLVENARLNGVEDVVTPVLGDNREVAPRGVADRVLMGYFPRTHRFLDVALRALAPPGGVVHYHDTAPADRWRDEMEAHARRAAAEARRPLLAAEGRVVKTFSPGMVHAVLDLRLGAQSAE